MAKPKEKLKVKPQYGSFGLIKAVADTYPNVGKRLQEKRNARETTWDKITKKRK